jgi:eukaryotic-like serine/threonine-protein kinase
MVDKLIGGRYRLLERHAIGGMAALWRARDERTGEIVALKRLHPYLANDPASRSRLVREAAALKAVDHPSITRPRDVIDDPDDPALVMEFAEGRSLMDRLAAEGPFEPEEAVAIAATVADALAVAHDAGIVHRDIKPANILVEDSGAVHLVDFGIATLGAADEAGLTVPGTMIGTVRYSAPERLAGAESTPRSDVWGLGAVLFEMLVGHPAVAVGEPQAGTDAEPGPVPETAALPPALAAVVRRAMAPDPNERYADAGAFRDAVLAGDGFVDPHAETAVVPLAASVARGPAAATLPSASRGFSAVDRAAAVFFSGAVAVTIAVAVVLGLGGADGTTAPPSAPPARVIDIAPSPTDTVATPAPDDNSGPGNGKGNGKGKGNDKDDEGGD